MSSAKKAKMLGLRGTEKNKITPARWYELEELLNEVYCICSPKPNDYQRRKSLVLRLNALAKEVYACSLDSPVVEAFGSFVMNMFIPGSDLDLSINFSDDGLEYPRKKKIKALRKFAKKLNALKRRGLVVAGLKIIMGARVPIVKVTDYETGIDYDLSVENRDGVIKSHIVYAISTIDERFQKLCILMKAWAKGKEINSSKDRTLNSISIISLVAVHLQTRNPPILPPFSELLKDGTNQASVLKIVPKYFDFAKRNKESLGYLFYSLLIKLEAVEKLWSTGLCASSFSGSWIRKAVSELEFMNVEDFIDRSQNVARAVGVHGFKSIYDCIHNSLYHLVAFLYGDIQVSKLRELLFHLGTISTLRDRDAPERPCFSHPHQAKNRELVEGWEGKRGTDGWGDWEGNKRMGMGGKRKMEISGYNGGKKQETEGREVKRGIDGWGDWEGKKRTSLGGKSKVEVLGDNSGKKKETEGREVKKGTDGWGDWEGKKQTGLGGKRKVEASGDACPVDGWGGTNQMYSGKKQQTEGWGVWGGKKQTGLGGKRKVETLGDRQLVDSLGGSHQTYSRKRQEMEAWERKRGTKGWGDWGGKKLTGLGGKRKVETLGDRLPVDSLGGMHQMDSGKKQETEVWDAKQGTEGWGDWGGKKQTGLGGKRKVETSGDRRLVDSLGEMHQTYCAKKQDTVALECKQGTEGWGDWEGKNRTYLGGKRKVGASGDRRVVGSLGGMHQMYSGKKEETEGWEGKQGTKGWGDWEEKKQTGSGGKRKVSLGGTHQTLCERKQQTEGREGKRGTDVWGVLGSAQLLQGECEGNKRIGLGGKRKVETLENRQPVDNLGGTHQTDSGKKQETEGREGKGGTEGWGDWGGKKQTSLGGKRKVDTSGDRRPVDSLGGTHQTDSGKKQETEGWEDWVGKKQTGSGGKRKVSLGGIHQTPNGRKEQTETREGKHETEGWGYWEGKKQTVLGGKRKVETSGDSRQVDRWGGTLVTYCGKKQQTEAWEGKQRTEGWGDWEGKKQTGMGGKRKVETSGDRQRVDGWGVTHETYCGKKQQTEGREGKQGTDGWGDWEGKKQTGLGGKRNVETAGDSRQVDGWGGTHVTYCGKKQQTEAREGKQGTKGWGDCDGKKQTGMGGKRKVETSGDRRRVDGWGGTHETYCERTQQTETREGKQGTEGWGDWEEKKQTYLGGKRKVETMGDRRRVDGWGGTRETYCGKKQQTEGWGDWEGKKRTGSRCKRKVEISRDQQPVGTLGDKLQAGGRGVNHQTNRGNWTDAATTHFTSPVPSQRSHESLSVASQIGNKQYLSPIKTPLPTRNSIGLEGSRCPPVRLSRKHPYVANSKRVKRIEGSHLHSPRIQPPLVSPRNHPVTPNPFEPMPLPIYYR